MRRVLVLYEDRQAQGALTEYGPHALIKQCVCDQLDVKPWELKLLIGNPMAGNGNVRKECILTSPKLSRDGGLVFAVYDSDRIRDLVGMSFTACKREVRELLLKECPWRDRLRVIFLEKNLETVLRAICECDPSIASEQQRAKAIDRKELSARDIILTGAATPSPRSRDLRDCVLDKVPSLRYLVQKLADACATLSLPGPTV